MTKDYYKILGVTEFESSENIKTAYRKLARKWHPDIAGNSENVILKFKEINEAYGILSDRIKRAEYDRARRFYSYAREEGYNKAAEKKGSGQNTEAEKKNEKKNFSTDSQKGGFTFNWEEIFYKQREKKSSPKGCNKEVRKGKDVYTDIEISLFEAIQGTEKIINMLQTETCPKCGGRRFVNGSICSACMGKGEKTQHKKFTVKIPAGIKNESKIRLAGEGEEGINGGSSGDLYISIHIAEKQDYKTEGLDILKTVTILPHEAVLGTNIKVRSLDCEYSVKIAPYTQNGQKIRLSGCGLMQNDEVGDMIIIVEIRIPRTLTSEEIGLYKKLESISKGNIRDNIYDR